MSRSWIFLSNPFLVVTDGSYRKMKIIGDYTLAALQSAVPPTPPAAKAVAHVPFSDLVDLLQPLVTDYNSSYINWLSSQGTQKGKTQSLTGLLKNLQSKQIEDWDLAIQQVYRQDTPQYMMLLPQRRKPFQQGSQEDRMAAVGALNIAIGTDPVLQTLKTDVSNTYDALVAANNTQKGSKTSTSGNSDAVEAARITLGQGLYSVLGSLMSYYYENPDEIARFFALEELRSKEQNIYNQDIKGGETKALFARTFTDGEMLKLTDRGDTILNIALVHEKNDSMPADSFALQPHEEETVPASALGAAGNRFLIIKNMNATEKGAFSVEVVEK